jgi:hypothetical protein
VYDKKLLWRANLYINEKVDPSTGLEVADAIDWNDQNPWVDGNDWNKAYTFQQTGYYFDGFLVSEAGQSGKQVIVPYSFTWMRDNNYYGAVAYEYNGQDSPFEYNFKMDNQYRILQYYYQFSGSFEGKASGETWDLPDNNPMPPWSNYTAPSHDHSFYMHGSGYPYGYVNQDPDARRVKTDILTANNYIPYVPALSMSFYPQPLPDGGTLISDKKFAGWSAGTDCIAFVQKSAGYSGTSYSYIKNTVGGILGTCLWGDSRGATMYPHQNNGCWMISSNTDIPENLDKVIPGDILYYGTDHIALVRAVKYNNDKRTTVPNQIYLIESVYGRDEDDVPFGKVINFRTVATYNDRSWVIARLKTNN